ncbi:MAG: hypothetical protein UU23_C0001G0099 [Candidatus Curtissbacteria bacterium GW2011_GWA1_40_9]|uniref:Uncharacterized protein n=1 Tax=Candidatus Curtissbacteria bacterium GW2011_GWA1_40_9 TaxID=1618408 RepID=A0A0G0W218_9BACT|nr:MAG: hypothetical protein UU23_C0001G0099 [Candidatus Curtissbacteria bacterium GW2011_GWA1_40_9]
MYLPKIIRHRKGFTLIEILVVIGILSILLSIVLIAINPARQFAQANNAQRRSDVNAILNSIHQFAADNNGTPPSGIIDSPLIVASSGAGTVNLCTDLVPTYIADMPIDPTEGIESPADSICNDPSATYNTAYTVEKSLNNNRITVSALQAELLETITVTR